MVATYEQSVRRLEAIVAELSNDAIPLSEAVVLFQEGVGRLRSASAELCEIEAQVKLLIEKSDGALRERNL